MHSVRLALVGRPNVLDVAALNPVGLVVMAHVHRNPVGEEIW